MEDKKFIKPEAEVIEFGDMDIITDSNPWVIGGATDDEMP